MVRRFPLLNNMDIAYFITYTNIMADIACAGNIAQQGNKGEPSALIDETLSATWQWSGSPKREYYNIPEAYEPKRGRL